MHAFLGVARCEYRMSIRRWGFWIPFALLFTPYVWAMGPAGSFDPGLAQISRAELWADAGQTMFQFNLFMPVAAGIVLADRLYRDRRLGVHELLSSTPLSRTSYLLGKYGGALLSALTPVLLGALILGSLSAAIVRQPVLVAYYLAAFLLEVAPAYAFITAFSLACPLIMPVRVYQVLYTGYWFWGNFLNPEALPTLAGTYLSPSGRFACESIFGGCQWSGPGVTPASSVIDAVLNLSVLAVCVLLVWLVTDRFLLWNARRV